MFVPSTVTNPKHLLAKQHSARHQSLREIRTGDRDSNILQESIICFANTYGEHAIAPVLRLTKCSSVKALYSNTTEKQKWTTENGVTEKLKKQKTKVKYCSFLENAVVSHQEEEEAHSPMQGETVRRGLVSPGGHLPRVEHYRRAVWAVLA